MTHLSLTTLPGGDNIARPSNTEHRKNKEQMILDAARNVFCRKGFTGVTMTDIIDECKISRGGIYLYFSSVEEIFQAVASRRSNEKFALIKKAVKDNQPFEAVLSNYMALQKERLLNMDNSILRAMYEYTFSKNEGATQVFRDTQLDNIRKSVIAILMLGVNQNLLRDNNIPELTDHFIIMIEGLSVLTLTKMLTEQIIDQQFNLFGKMLDNIRISHKTKVLITAGGTIEDIDDVRCISNHSTGRLGSLIADAFTSAGYEVTYLCSETALLPKKQAQIIKIRNTKQLLNTLCGLLKNTEFGCVVHSMAVSDFVPAGFATADEVYDTIKGSIEKKEFLRVMDKPNESKISSDASETLLLLKRSPKVIDKIKQIQPETMLVGFKLLSNVPEEKLVSAANKLINRSGCDIVLANDLSGILGDNHKAMLIDRNGILERFNTKSEIAAGILNHFKRTKESEGAFE